LLRNYSALKKIDIYEKSDGLANENYSFKLPLFNLENPNCLCSTWRKTEITGIKTMLWRKNARIAIL